MQSVMPDDFLRPEIREGVLIDEKKKKLFKVSISILEEIKSICRRHQLRYFAAYGTLLGAVRHKGFIPWDDDMDLWMPREDYDKFSAIAPKELRSPYFFQSRLTDPEYESEIIKVRYNDSTATEKWRLELGLRMNMGIWVSIFPLDGRPQDDYDIELIFARKYLWTKLLRTSARRLKRRTFKSNLIKICSMLLVAIIGRSRIANIINKFNYWYPFVGSEKCCCMTSLHDCISATFLTKWFNESIEVPFEYSTIRVPSAYDSILTQQYGDWRTPVKGTAEHEIYDLEPDIPYKIFLERKYGMRL